jgi:hypothetical protein
VLYPASSPLYIYFSFLILSSPKATPMFTIPTEL